MPIATPLTNYQLDRPGCSGIACGPYLSIRDSHNLEHKLNIGATGAVCVRGFPTFDGYEISSDPKVPLDRSTFSSEGWFDSGDLGYMDSDGQAFKSQIHASFLYVDLSNTRYLYLTGRSKEIINRGGEVISPLEVEEAIVTVAKAFVKVSYFFLFYLPHLFIYEQF
jgi:acyl-CoA synthetase (AMP-forming)/AMP-acid ligase II